MTVNNLTARLLIIKADFSNGNNECAFLTESLVPDRQFLE